MKTDPNLIARLDKFSERLLDLAENVNPEPDKDQPPVTLAERIKTLDSVVGYLTARSKMEVDGEAEGGISGIVQQLHGRAPKGRPRRESSSRREVGPGYPDIAPRDRFGPDASAPPHEQ